MVNNVFTGKETIQEFFFKQSLVECGVGFTNKDVKINHIKGENFLFGVKYNIVFPISLINSIKLLPKEKSINYFFRGNLGNNRNWVLNFSNDGYVENSLYGRDSSKKYIPDLDYYTKMCSSNFTLCPVGSCPWSYRLFESILCHSIPIVDTTTNDIYRDEFMVYDKNENHTYDDNIVTFNYDKLITKFTLKSLHKK
jgi:hypothetical protein